MGGILRNVIANILFFCPYSGLFCSFLLYTVQPAPKVIQVPRGLTDPKELQAQPGLLVSPELLVTEVLQVFPGHEEQKEQWVILVLQVPEDRKVYQGQFAISLPVYPLIKSGREILPGIVKHLLYGHRIINPVIVITRYLQMAAISF